MLNKILLVLSLTIFSITLSNAQSGVSVQAGIITGSSGDKVVTPDGTGLYGYTIGADARLFAEGLYFNVGMHYSDLDLVGSESLSFFGGDSSMKLLRGRIGLGVYIANIKELIRLRAKTGLKINYIQSATTDDIKNRPTHNRINDSHLGAALGLGLDISIFTFDLEYEIGAINAYFDAPDSKISYLSLTAGVFF